MQQGHPWGGIGELRGSGKNTRFPAAAIESSNISPPVLLWLSPVMTPLSSDRTVEAEEVYF